MTFEEVLDRAIAMLQRRGRLTYRTLKRQFNLDDEALEDLKLELTEKILTSCPALKGERKQVTVLFTDIKDSTELSRDLDPEAAQQLLDPVIHRMMAMAPQKCLLHLRKTVDITRNSLRLDRTVGMMEADQDRHSLAEYQVGRPRMPTVHLTLRQLQEAIESLTPEEFRQLDDLLDTRRRARLTAIVHKTRRNAAKVSPEEADQIIQEALAEVRAEHASHRSRSLVASTCPSTPGGGT
jgi:hypothetical protein